MSSSPGFEDASLVLLGHGTTLNDDSKLPVYQHAGELRRRKIFADVYEALWKQEPQVREVLTHISTPRVFLVPLFISEGYFSEAVIPMALGFRAAEQGNWSRLLQRAQQRLHYCKPVGTDDTMTEVLLARAREVLERFPFPVAPKPEETTLIIAGHGTEKNENSRKAIDQQVELIRRMQSFAAVHAVFLEEEPRIARWPEFVQTKNVVVVPFFISDGLHTQEDIPVLLGEAEGAVRQRRQANEPTWNNPSNKRGKLLWYAKSIGTAPELAEVILDRVREAAGWNL
jgi:sirohydrochlorin cobaltochelatase